MKPVDGCSIEVRSYEDFMSSECENNQIYATAISTVVIENPQSMTSENIYTWLRVALLAKRSFEETR